MVSPKRKTELDVQDSRCLMLVICFEGYQGQSFHLNMFVGECVLLCSKATLEGSSFATPAEKRPLLRSGSSLQCSDVNGGDE